MNEKMTQNGRLDYLVEEFKADSVQYFVYSLWAAEKDPLPFVHPLFPRTIHKITIDNQAIVW